jgi:hypothetical protein
VRYPHVGSWLTVILGMYCLHSARPMKHAIDSFFAVSRSSRWNESLLTASLVLCFVAFVLALVAATVRLLEPRNKYWSPPYGPFVASGLALVTLLAGGLRL